MSGVLASVGKVAGIVASVAAFVPGGQPVAAIASAVAVTAGVGAQLTAKKPPRQGSTSDIQIGANMPSPYLIGESYYGGSRLSQVGYGEEDDVPNAHLWVVDAYSVGGPLQSLEAVYADFVPLTFSGTNAVGYFNNNLHRTFQLGATPESAALSPHWSGAPDWGASYKLSGKAAIGYSARFPKKGDVYAAGFIQTGAKWRGQKAYDPRLDGTYPGGSGPHRWADPSDKVAFSAAKATWTYNANPGLQALRYALGIFERDETNPSAEYRKVFGIGGKWDQLVVEDFVELANVCDQNSWTVNGVIFEPGDKWANLKRILAAGGAEPVFKGAKLGVKMNTPRVSLDTITMADIGEGEPSVPGCRPFTDRLYTFVSKYISPSNRWESVAAGEVHPPAYTGATDDGRTEEITFDLVTNPTQATELTAYEAANRFEIGPIDLPLLPRLRQYRAGHQLDLAQEVQDYFGVSNTEVLVATRSCNPEAMTWSFSFVTETPEKHPWALGQSGSAPPPTTAVPTENYDAPTEAGGEYDGGNATNVKDRE